MVLVGHAYCVAGRPLGAAVQARVRPLGAGVYLQGTQAVNRRSHIHQARTHQKRGVSLTQGVQSDVVEPLSHLRKCLRQRSAPINMTLQQRAQSPCDRQRLTLIHQA